MISIYPNEARFGNNVYGHWLDEGRGGLGRWEKTEEHTFMPLDISLKNEDQV